MEGRRAAHVLPALIYLVHDMDKSLVESLVFTLHREPIGESGDCISGIFRALWFLSHR